MHHARERQKESEAEHHPTRLHYGEPDSQRNAKQENETDVGEHLRSMVDEKLLIQDVVDQVGVNFGSREIETAERRSTQVANSGGGRSDEHDLVFESAIRKFLQRRIGKRDVRIGARRAVVIHHKPADVVRMYNEVWPKFHADDSAAPIRQDCLFVGEAEI